MSRWLYVISYNNGLYSLMDGRGTVNWLYFTTFLILNLFNTILDYLH